MTAVLTCKGSFISRHLWTALFAPLFASLLLPRAGWRRHVKLNICSAAADATKISSES